MKKFLLSLGLGIITAFSWGQNDWDGDNPVGNFSYCDNWYSNTCPSSWNSSADLNFNLINNSSQTSIYFDLGAWKSIKSLIYASTLPKSIDFNGDGNGFDFYWKVENYSGYSQTITIPFSGKGTVIELNPINGDFTFTNTIFNDNNVDYFIYGNNSKLLTLTGTPIGNSAVKMYIKQYSKVLINYNNTTSFGGGVDVETGELWIGANSAINGGNITLGTGGSAIAKVYIQSPSTPTTVFNNIEVASNSTNCTIGGLNSSNVHTYFGNINLNNNIVYFDEVDYGAIHCSGIISGTGGINKIGVGGLILSNTNTYTGGTTITAGTLQIGNGATGSILGDILNNGSLIFWRSNDYDFSGIISGTGSVKKMDTGKLTLSGNNTYSGFTNIIGGTIELGTSNVIADNSTFILQGGTLSTGATVGYDETLSTLNVLTSSSINLGSGSHELHFLDSHTAAWLGTLTIYGWDFLNAGKIYFGSDATGLSSLQLAQINFDGFGTGAYILSDGEVVPALLNCSNTVTWTSGTWSPSAPNTHSNVIIDAGNYALYSDAEYCSLTVSSGASLTVTKGVTLQVYNDIQNSGTINIDNNASLVQVNETDTNSGTGTYNIVKTTGTYKNYDYFYWSSPVKNETIGTVFPTVYYKHQFNPANYLDLFSGHGHPQPTAGSDGYDDDGDDWTLVDNSYVMPQGIGFITMGIDSPTSFNVANMNVTQAGFNATFTGESVHNGTFTANVYQDAYASGANAYNNNLNLLGNPYPSAIDVYELYHENASVLEGKFYFWTHDAPLAAIGGPNTYDFNNNSFAIGTITGTYPSYTYTQTLSGTSQSAPRYIASAQGFMASAIDGISSPSTISYKNTMRPSGNNSTFLRHANQENTASRIWLNLTGADKFNQIAIGFDTSTSDAYGMGDAPRIASADNTDFYSLISGTEGKFAIQFLSEFTTDKVVPLGISVLQPDSYQITIDHTDGIFSSGQNVYLEDTYQNLTHNLSGNPYTFYSETSNNINDRFMLRFTTEALDINPVALQNLTLYPNPSTGVVYVNYSGTEQLAIEVFDLLGKRIIARADTHVIDLSACHAGIYLVKCSTPTGSITRKIVKE